GRRSTATACGTTRSHSGIRATGTSIAASSGTCARSFQGRRRNPRAGFPRAIRSAATSVDRRFAVSSPPVRKLRVLVLMHHYLVPPDDVSGHDLATAEWRTEYDVLKTIRDELEH